MRPLRMTAIIGGKRYATDKSALLADDASPNQNEARGDTNQFLFRTERGDYFVQHRQFSDSCFDGARDWVRAINEMDAVMLYRELPEKQRAFEEAFPQG